MCASDVIPRLTWAVVAFLGRTAHISLSLGFFRSFQSFNQFGLEFRLLRQRTPWQRQRRPSALRTTDRRSLSRNILRRDRRQPSFSKYVKHSFHFNFISLIFLKTISPPPPPEPTSHALDPPPPSHRFFHFSRSPEFRKSRQLIGCSRATS